MSNLTTQDHELFTEFISDPKGSSMDIILGAHRFLAAIIENKDDGPTLKTLMKIFRPFIPTNSIKDYVFKRIKKSLLLELALCILQDVATNGLDRLGSLNLVIEKTNAGGKNVVIQPSEEDFGDASTGDDKFLNEIDEIFFRFSIFARR